MSGKRVEVGKEGGGRERGFIDNQEVTEGGGGGGSD